jgi:hypothetical protein
VCCLPTTFPAFSFIKPAASLHSILPTFSSIQSNLSFKLQPWRSEWAKGSIPPRLGHLALSSLSPPPLLQPANPPLCPCLWIRPGLLGHRYLALPFPPTLTGRPRHRTLTHPISARFCAQRQHNSDRASRTRFLVLSCIENQTSLVRKQIHYDSPTSAIVQHQLPGSTHKRPLSFQSAAISPCTPLTTPHAHRQLTCSGSLIRHLCAQGRKFVAY